MELACIYYTTFGVSQVLDIGYKENHYWDNIKLLLMVNILRTFLRANLELIISTRQL